MGAQMAKHSISKSRGTSRFRMIVIDAELQEGEISQLAQAIQGAFGGQRAAASRLNGTGLRSLPSPGSDTIAAELETGEIVEDAGAMMTEPAPAKPKTLKKLRTPNLDGDLHPGEAPSLEAYAMARGVTGTSPVLRKFLVVAAWLHEQRSETKITADRAYTCFRFIGWPSNIDFDQPLRDLSRSSSQCLKLKPEDKGKGEFTITHLGLAKVNKRQAAS
jgi:hypothetical protein